MMCSIDLRKRGCQGKKWGKNVENLGYLKSEDGKYLEGVRLGGIDVKNQ